MSDTETSAQKPDASLDPFLVDLGAFEGPLDLLLDLARREKIDLGQLSIARLADQYLAYIEDAHGKHLELAADYLVMAAWLAYLKSRLLLPDLSGADDAPSAAELADNLARRLRHLNAVRQAGEELMRRPRLGIDVFMAPADGKAEEKRAIRYDASLYDLLSAYARQRQREVLAHVTVRERPVLAIADARDMLKHVTGGLRTWTRFDDLLTRRLPVTDRKTVTASSFGAILELVRDGTLELRQLQPFSPLYVRSRTAQPQQDEPHAILRR